MNKDINTIIIAENRYKYVSFFLNKAMEYSFLEKTKKLINVIKKPSTKEIHTALVISTIIKNKIAIQFIKPIKRKSFFEELIKEYKENGKTINNYKVGLTLLCNLISWIVIDYKIYILIPSSTKIYQN